MNPKKRKAEDEEQDNKHENNTEFDVKDNQNKSLKSEDIVTNSENKESENLTDPPKKDNGGSSTQPGTSVESKEETNDVANSSAEPRDQKQICLETSEKGGTLLFCGATNWDLVGRRELPKNAKGAVGPNLWGPHKIAALQGIKIRGCYAGCCACHSVIVTDNGVPYSWGRNDKSQLGHCDTKRRDIPTIVDTLKEHNIIQAACGRGHTLFLTDRGIVFSTGDNKNGQCGVNSQNNQINIPTKVIFKGSRPITKVACGAEFSLIVDSKGLLYSFGYPEYGQLGHNSDNKYFVSSKKMSFSCELVPRRIIAFIDKSREGHVTLLNDIVITDIACGINHSVAVDSKKRCFSWGFGGYGRLGHAVQKDEMVPRLIKTFDGPKRGVKRVFAGGTFSMAINEFDVLFLFGQNKRAGEANMYPKPVSELYSMKVRDVGCANCSIVCLADDSVVAYGPSPTYGELGYGEHGLKSSTTPREVKPLDGIHIQTLACGYGHTLFIASDETEEDRKKLNQLPEFTP